MTAINPIGSKNLQFRRLTARYGKKGTYSKNRGYLQIARDTSSGQFVSRKALIESAVEDTSFAAKLMSRIKLRGFTQ